MPTMTTNHVHIDRLEEERIVPIEVLPPMRYNEESWFVVQDEGWKYLAYPNHNNNMSDEEIMNKLYIELRKVPGDIVFKVMAKAFDLDAENKEVAKYIYEIACRMGIRQ